MPDMVDPMNALVSFQHAFKRKEIDVRPGIVDRKIFSHHDEPLGVKRYSYVKLQGRTVMAFVNFSPADFIEGAPCYQAGVAVPEALRGQGRARAAVSAAIEELKAEFRRSGEIPFWIEAIVHADNIASQRVAEATISSNPIAVTDQRSGDRAFQYLMKVV